MAPEVRTLQKEVRRGCRGRARRVKRRTLAGLRKHWVILGQTDRPKEGPDGNCSWRKGRVNQKTKKAAVFLRLPLFRVFGGTDWLYSSSRTGSRSSNKYMGRPLLSAITDAGLMPR